MDQQITALFRKYLSNSATADEMKELDEWIASNEDFHDWLENQVDNSSAEMDAEKQADILVKIHEKIAVQSKPKFVLPGWMKTVAAVALIVLMAASAAIYFRSNQPNKIQYAEIGALRGQKASVTLPDGTKITLNSESSLKYSTNYNQSDRAVELVGEAYFEVAKNKKIPFVVKAGKLEIEAKGTAFNIKAYPTDNSISTTLTEGKIEVKTPLDVLNMIPNERMEYNNTDQTFRKLTLTDAVGSIGWLNDELSFENATLAEVVANFSRIYNIDIQFASESIKEQRFTGKINNNSLLSVLRIISLTSPIRFEQKDSVVILYEVPSEKKLFQVNKNLKNTN
jgi:ferric-dicitrate binding protein FerR (iron transport regulator)